MHKSWGATCLRGLCPLPNRAASWECPGGRLPDMQEKQSTLNPALSIFPFRDWGFRGSFSPLLKRLVRAIPFSPISATHTYNHKVKILAKRPWVTEIIISMLPMLHHHFPALTWFSACPPGHRAPSRKLPLCGASVEGYKWVVHTPPLLSKPFASHNIITQESMNGCVRLYQTASLTRGNDNKWGWGWGEGKGS